MPQDTSSRLDHLDALRGVLIIQVVAIHALGYAALPAGTLRNAIDLVVSTIAVQGFYFVDGLLFARRVDRYGGPGAASYLADSVRRLIWPWLLFSLGYAAARSLAEHAGLVDATALSVGEWSPGWIVESIWWSHAAPHLYFLPSLFIIRCAAVAGWRLSRAPAWLIAAGAVGWLVLFREILEPSYLRLVPHEGLDPLLHALGGAGFFALGAAVWRHSGESRRLSAGLLAVLVAAAGLGSFGDQAVFNVAAQLAYLIPLYELFSRFGRSWTTLNGIGRRTMGIDLLHMPVVMKACIVMISRVVDPAGLAAYALLVAASFAAAWAISLAIERIGLAGLIFGERARPAMALQG